MMPLSSVKTILAPWRKCAQVESLCHLVWVLMLIGVVCAVAAEPLDSLVGSYRDSPTAARRAVLQQFAAAHKNEQSGVLARFALGMTAFSQKDYAASVTHLKGLEKRLPKLSDYVAYYSAAAKIELKDYDRT